MFTCPACDRPINQASEVCPYCGTDLAPSPIARRRKAQHKGLVITLVSALVLVAVIWAIIWFVLPHPDVPPRAEAEAGAIAALQHVDAALNSYMRQQGTYPDTIQQVSAAAGPAYANARNEGYTLVYRAGQPDNRGNIRQFTLHAQPQIYGYRSFFLDQTGVIRATRQSRSANAHDPPIS